MVALKPAGMLDSEDIVAPVQMLNPPSIVTTDLPTYGWLALGFITKHEF